MDLKSALKDILPRLTLKSRKKTDEWAIDRPVEFHECDTCGEMVDQRVVDICITTCSEEYSKYLVKEYRTWCDIHNSIKITKLASGAKPCSRCYRWSTTHSKSSVCWSCTHNPWCEYPPPMIRNRPWYVPPKGTE